MYQGLRVTLIIPALNEEDAIGPLLEEIDKSVVDWVVVVDNGSTDRTGECARQGGALVLRERRRGYGSACLKAINEGPESEIVLFMDGDGSDDPAEIEMMLNAMIKESADMVIGSRVTGQAEEGALTPVQRFGNALTCTLVRFLWGVTYTDLGPFRAIQRTALKHLDMRDPDFGWTIEMQVKAAQAHLKTIEVPVNRRVRRAGTSKVSGSLIGSWRAGTRILRYVFEAKVKELIERRSGR